MKKHFYIFRHGQTDYNVEGRLQGQSLNISLNETGISQAKTVAETLKDVNLDVIYSSSLKRAFETADIIAKKRNIPHITDDRIIEINFGTMEGMSIFEIKEKYPVAYAKWHNESDMEYDFETGENRLKVIERVDAFFSEVIDSDYTNIAIATHGALLKRFMMHIGKRLDKIPNCHIFNLVYNNGKWE